MLNRLLAKNSEIIYSFKATPAPRDAIQHNNSAINYAWLKVIVLIFFCRRETVDSTLWSFSRPCFEVLTLLFLVAGCLKVCYKCSKNWHIECIFICRDLLWRIPSETSHQAKSRMIISPRRLSLCVG